MAEQRVEHLSGLVQRGQRGKVLRRQHCPVRHVEPAHHDLQTAAKYAGRGFRIDSNIELRIRRKVTAPGGTAHDHQPANIKATFRVLRQEQRNIGQRTNRHQRNRLLSMHQRIANGLKGRFRQWLTVMLDKIIPFHAGLAVHGGRIAQRAQERHRRSLSQRNLRLPEMQQLQGVTRGFFHRHVPRHRRHQLQIELGGE